MAAGLARHGLLPVVNSFASFLASRANEQIYNQASERTKVVYALHYAGLIPAGPGKSHQSVRDISLLAALPNVTIVQPANAEETRALLRWAVEDAEETVAIRLAIGPSPRRIELDGGSQPGRGTVLRDGDGRDAARVRAGDAARGAHRRGGAGGSAASTCASWHAVAEPLRRRLARDELGDVRATSSSSRITRRSAGSATRSAARSTAGRRRRSFGVEGWPACGTPAEALARPRARRRVARGADRARPRVAAEPVSDGRPVWVVLPDPLSIRLFFDCGIVERPRGAPRRAPRGRLPRAARGGGGVGCGRVPARGALPDDDLAAAGGLARAALRRGRPLARRAASATTRSRSASTTGTGSTASAWQPGHRNWMLDSTRDGPLPRWDLGRACDGALALLPAPSRPARAARADASASGPRSCSRNVQPAARAVPHRCAAARPARRRRTSRAGTTPSARA